MCFKVRMAAQNAIQGNLISCKHLRGACATDSVSLARRHRKYTAVRTGQKSSLRDGRIWKHKFSSTHHYNLTTLQLSTFFQGNCSKGTSQSETICIIVWPHVLYFHIHNYSLCGRGALFGGFTPFRARPTDPPHRVCPIYKWNREGREP